jgi:hypothetical protein
MWQRLFRVGLAVAVGLMGAILTARALPAAHATNVTGTGLAVYVGYAEDKETNNPNPAAFPVPWVGSPNSIFLGGPVVGQTACGTLPLCYDAGAIRLDNPTATAIAISNVTVDVHSAIAGGKRFSLWGAFTVPAGKSVILTENPPGNNPSYDNFDTSGFPANVCTPISIAPTVTITSGGTTTTLVDSTHVLDTGGIDTGYCPPHHNESLQWRPIGAPGSTTASLTLTPVTSTLAPGQQTNLTAHLVDGGGTALANVPVTFAVTNGPDVGQTANAVTDATGQASFTLTNATAGTDLVRATVTTVGSFSTVAAMIWGSGATAGWTDADIGAPPLAGNASLANGVWTVSGSGRDIGGTSDQFHFVWQLLPGDGGMQGRVVMQTNTNSRARAGLMLRASSDPAAPFYALLVTPQRGIFVLARATAGGTVTTVASIPGTVPLFVQVLRAGTTFTAATSLDGTTWTPIPGATCTLPLLTGMLLDGMAVTSHTVTQRSTATFDLVSLR